MTTLKRYTGSVWETIGLPSDIGMTPQTLGYAQVTANTATFTAETDLAGLAVTVVVPEGRRLRITAIANFESSVAADEIAGNIKEGATLLGRFFQETVSTANRGHRGEGSVVISPSAGVHTYKLSAQRVTGTGNVLMTASANLPAFILVEDITGSTLPYQPASIPVGLLGVGYSPGTQATISTEVDITGLSVNVVVPAGRTLRISCHTDTQSTVDGDVPLVNIKEDGVTISRLTMEYGDAANRSFTMFGSVLRSPAAGVHTYKATIQRAAGTGTLTVNGASAQVYLAVEDVTPTPAPSDGAPGSTLGYAEVTASQAGITAETDLTGLSVNVTVPAGRRIKITGRCRVASSVSGDRVQLRIMNGATPQGNSGLLVVSTLAQSLEAKAIVTPSAGSQTYRLTLARVTGTGNIDMSADPTFPAFILVEDITGSVWPEGSEVTAGMVVSEPWTPWTPTWTGVTIDNGVVEARYQKVGRTVHLALVFTLGSTSAITGDAFFSLPYPMSAHASIGRQVIGQILFEDTSAINIVGQLWCNRVTFPTLGRLLCATVSGGFVGTGAISATSPFTWVSGDKIDVTATYEAAS